jgi:hypothetical protein
MLVKCLIDKVLNITHFKNKMTVTLELSGLLLNTKVLYNKD